MSKFGKNFKSNNLNVSENIYNGLVRLPLYPSLTDEELNRIILTSKKFLKLI
jgi:dTDP-4-amino-4,6-dideoxygalactose transaminase